MAILDNVSGVIQPGRMTLQLGPPAAGKSTLLKALAGKLAHERGLTVRLGCPSPASRSCKLRCTGVVALLACLQSLSMPIVLQSACC